MGRANFAEARARNEVAADYDFATKYAVGVRNTSLVTFAILGATAAAPAVAATGPGAAALRAV